MPIGVYPRESVETRFRDNVNTKGPIHPVLGTPCWEWVASQTDGYGQFHALGEFYAHRVSYRLFVGDITKGLLVCHKCDNRLCVRPAHLFLGTNQDNIIDMFKKGRANRENASPRRNLPVMVVEVVLQIRQLHTEGVSQAELSRMFNASAAQVSRIVNRLTWKDV